MNIWQLEVAPQVNALPDPQIAFGYFISRWKPVLGHSNLRYRPRKCFPGLEHLEAKENAAIQAAKAKYELFEETKSKLI